MWGIQWWCFLRVIWRKICCQVCTFVLKYSNYGTSTPAVGTSLFHWLLLWSLLVLLSYGAEQHENTHCASGEDFLLFTLFQTQVIIFHLLFLPFPTHYPFVQLSLPRLVLDTWTLFFCHSTPVLPELLTRENLVENMNVCVYEKGEGGLTLPLFLNQKRHVRVKQHFPFIRETECFPNFHWGRCKEKRREMWGWEVEVVKNTVKLKVEWGENKGWIWIKSIHLKSKKKKKVGAIDNFSILMSEK